MSACELSLPWPPTVNTYWRSIVIKGQSRVLISSRGREYQADVAKFCMVQRAPHRLPGRLGVTITAHPPDRRARDLDNLTKSLLDSLTKAGVWSDDSQIDDLRIVRAAVLPEGRVMVAIRVLSDEPEQSALELAA